MVLTICNWITGNPGVDDELQLVKSRDDALCARAADINTQLEAEEMQPGRKRKRQVEYWLKSVEELHDEVQCFEQEVEQGVFSSHKVLRRKILSLTKEMEDLMEQGNFPGELTLYDHACSSVPLVTTELKGRMFEANLRLILSWLNDDRVSRIGVYGLGGVGKTTLAMHIHNKLHEYNKTSVHVYWITVSQESGLYKLQNKIARAAKLDHLLEKEEEEVKRAAVLYAALKHRKKVVLFLDDMWQHFSVQKVGLPVGEGECKLVITTRSLDVCKRMDCQRWVKVEPLVEEESWELFTEKLGNLDDLSLEARDVAVLVAKQCAGLPLAILAVAGSMRGVADMNGWSNALEEVSNSTRHHDDMESDVFPLLELSYARLNDVKLQKCFLSCALYPEDSKLGRYELIQFWVSDGLLEEIDGREKQLDKGYTILNRLINASLLEAMDSRGEYVKMHDLIRDMAIKIGRDTYHFMIRAGQQLTKIPDDREWTQDLTKVSLISNYISEIPSSVSPMCPCLSTLLLEDNPLRSIPDSLFLHLKSLCFLNITQALIEKLPDSISDLGNLSALEIRSCSKLSHLPSLSNLKKLRELDLRYNILLKDVPVGSDGLPNLRFLSLLGCEKLCVQFHQLISGLPNVECLELGFGVRSILGKDLMKVENLTRVKECWVSDVSDFNSYVKSHHYHKLRCYQFYIGPRDLIISQIDHLYDRTVVINRYSLSKAGKNEALMLPDTIQLLQLTGADFSIRSLQDAVPSLHGLTRLSRIWLGYCDGLEYIWPSTPSSIIELKILEELNLLELPNLRGIAEGGAPPGVTLHYLKKLTVEYCSNIRKLFTPSLLSQLQNLHVLEVQVCQKLVEIVAVTDDTEGESSRAPTAIDRVDDVVFFRKLRNLQLVYLPNLVTICTGGLLGSDLIEEMIIVRCPKLIKKFPFSLPLLDNGQPSGPPPCLRRLVVEREWWESLEWEHPGSKKLFQPFVQFSCYGTSTP